MKYLNLLNQTTEEKEKKNNVLIAKEAKLNLQTVQLRIEREIASKEIAMEKLKGCNPFRPELLYAVYNELQLLQREQKFYSSLEEELF